jgi:hypothetical protein
MIKIPTKKHADLIAEEVTRHDTAMYELEKTKRIELGKIFGVSEDDVLATDRHGHWESKWDIIDKHFKMLVQNESGDLVFSASRSGCENSQDGEIIYYHGTQPKKNRSHKGFSVRFIIYQAPNGLWIGEANQFRCPPQSHNFGGHRHYHFTEAFKSQEEAFALCVNQAVHVLTGPIEVDTDPQEIEVPCPTCEAWAKANTKKDEDGREYVYPNHEGLKCPTCKDSYDQNNEIERTETPEETKARIAIESKDRGFDPQYQPQADAFANELLEMVGLKAGQQLSLF